MGTSYFLLKKENQDTTSSIPSLIFEIYFLDIIYAIKGVTIAIT